jgi:septum formation protein
MTGFAVVSRQQAIEVIDAHITQVAFDRFDDVVLRAYVDSGEPMDKAGAYGIQDRGAFLVRSITGSYSNVVGLPLNAVVQTLLRCGLAVPA